MKSKLDRFCTIALFAFLASSVLVLARPATAQDPRPEDEQFAIVTADNVYVRSGAGDSFYPFGKVRAGDVVKVIGEKFNWTRVATVGPAFGKFFGYLRYPAADAGLFRLDENGRKGRTFGKVDLFAPNLNTQSNPMTSWKRILQLEPNVELPVLESSEIDGAIVQKVPLPKNAEGWISTAYLRPATPTEVLAWRKSMTTPATAKADEKTAKPATPGAATPEGVLAREEQAVPPIATKPAVIKASTTTPATPQPAATNASGRPASLADATPKDEVPTTPGSTTAAPTEALPPVTPEPAATPVPRTAQQKLDDLEGAYRLLRQEPIESAEVLQLRELYLKLKAETAEDRTVNRYASARAEQLAIWADLQKRRVELAKFRKRLDLTVEETEAVRLVLESTGDYIAVGRLAVSTIYDGRRLPQLFRLQDPATGRTLAYLRPDKGFNLTAMLGQVIGILGSKSFDDGLRLNVIKPSKIDLLTPQR